MNRPIKMFAVFLFSIASYAQVSYLPNSGELSIDAAGSSGSDGSEGSASYYSSGSNGSDGQPGRDAADIDLFLSYSDSSRMRVEVKISSNYSSLNFQKVFSLTELKSINLFANGGNGGNGGSGGKGGDGSDGSSGSSGCPASDGSSGTSGSNGGNGGSGGNGGRGGNIRITTSDDQSELLMLIRSTQISGGSYGSAGSGGAGGSGGRGGSGGSNSCSSGGSSGSSGSDGWSGSSGSSGNDGYSGQSGRQIYMLSGKTTNAYPEKFNLKIQSVEFADENNDGIFEFGEKVSITKVKIVNSSTMPSPVNLDIAGLNNIDSNWKWLSPDPKKTIKSLSNNEGIEISFTPGEFAMKAADMTSFRDIATKMPIGFLKENLVGYFDSLPVLNIKRLAALTSTSSIEKIFWGQKRSLSLSINNQTQLPIGRQGMRPLWLQVNLISTELEPADLKLFYGNTEIAFDGQKQALVELESLKPGLNSLGLTLLVGNRTNLYVDARLEFKILKLKASSTDKEPIDSQPIKLSLAKDLLADSYVFKVPIKDKIQCFMGPRKVKRTLKQISLIKKGNDPNVELGITFSNLIIFSQDLPKFYQGRLEFAKYLNDFKSNQIKGQKLVEILNDYYKPATISMFSSIKKETDSVIESCILVR